LFDTAPVRSDDEAFAQSVSARVAALPPAGAGVLSTVATAVAGLVVVLELSQPTLWTDLASWLNQAGAPLVDRALWTTPNAGFCAAALGAMLLSAYVWRLLRES
jgi:hypothetical protein